MLNTHLNKIVKAATLAVKNLTASAGDIRDLGLIPWSGRSPGVGNGYPFQYSCLENSMDRGAWWGRRESDTTEQLITVELSSIVVVQSLSGV